MYALDTVKYSVLNTAESLLCEVLLISNIFYLVVSITTEGNGHACQFVVFVCMIN